MPFACWLAAADSFGLLDGADCSALARATGCCDGLLDSGMGGLFEVGGVPACVLELLSPPCMQIRSGDQVETML